MNIRHRAALCLRWVVAAIRPNAFQTHNPLRLFFSMSLALAVLGLFNVNDGRLVVSSAFRASNNKVMQGRMNIFMPIVAHAFNFAARALQPISEHDASASAGNIYGAPWGSDSLHNLDVGGAEEQSISFRFRAAKTNRLKSIRLFWTENRFRPGYAKGDGGRIKVLVLADSGTAKHEPSGTALASLTFDPGLVNGIDPQGVNGIFRLLQFPAPAKLEEGKLYHLTFTNLDGRPSDNYVGLDLNIVYDGESQPATQEVDFGVMVNTMSLGWRDASRDFAQQKPNTLSPIVSLDYADGTSQGSGYMEVWWQQPRQIGEDHAVRESILPSHAVNGVQSVSLRVRQLSDSGSLTVGLEAEDGTQIAKANVPASPTGKDRNEWLTAWFDAPVNLLAGQRYYLMLTSKNGKYEAYCIRDGQSFGFGRGSVFADGHAEFNRADGSGWQGWDGWSSAGGSDQINGDLQFYFSTQPNFTQTPTPATAGIEVTDDLSDTTKILTMSNARDFYLETVNAHLMDGDTSRLTRGVTTAEWMTWQLNGVRSVTATTYFWPGTTVNHFAFEYSNDNVSFTSIAPTINDAGGDWHKYVYSVSLPAGANYIRIIFPVSTKYWTPQLGQVLLAT